MENDAKPGKEEVSAAARMAGIVLAPESIPNVLSLLLEARSGVLQFADDIDDEVVPATVFLTDYR